MSPEITSGQNIDMAFFLGEKMFFENWVKSVRIRIGLQDPMRFQRVFAEHFLIPIGSMYGIFTYIWLICMVKVGKYTIHGSYGI